MDDSVTRKEGRRLEQQFGSAQVGTIFGKESGEGDRVLGLCRLGFDGVLQRGVALRFLTNLHQGISDGAPHLSVFDPPLVQPIQNLLGGRVVLSRAQQLGQHQVGAGMIMIESERRLDLRLSAMVTLQLEIDLGLSDVGVGIIWRERLRLVGSPRSPRRRDAAGRRPNRAGCIPC